MQITAATTFLDEYDRFEEGQTYDVAPERGNRFVSHRWATSPDVDQSWLDNGNGTTATTLPGAALIEPDDMTHQVSNGVG